MEVMSKQEVKIVIVEDDLYQNKALTKYISTICNEQMYKNYKFDIKSYTTAHQCIEELEEDLDIIVLDYYLINEKDPDVLTGGDVVNIVKGYCPNCEIIMISSQEDEQVVADLIKKGITYYVNKNVNSINRVGAVVQRILNNRSLSNSLQH